MHPSNVVTMGRARARYKAAKVVGESFKVWARRMFGNEELVGKLEVLVRGKGDRNAGSKQKKAG
jgi:hypothetical protein